VNITNFHASHVGRPNAEGQGRSCEMCVLSLSVTITPGRHRQRIDHHWAAKGGLSVTWPTRNQAALQIAKWAKTWPKCVCTECGL